MVLEQFHNILLGGPGHGQPVSGDIDGGDLTYMPDTPVAHRYNYRVFEVDGIRHFVWVDNGLNFDVSADIVRWCARGISERTISAQRDLLRENYEGGMRYANVVMALGYAGLLAFWVQLGAQMGPATRLWSALLIAVSLVAFIGWEIFGMIMRGRLVAKMADSLRDPTLFAQKIHEARESGTDLITKIMFASYLTLAFAVGTALAGFLTMGSAAVHWLWHQ